MSVMWDNGYVVFECDRCGELLETAEADFSEAVAAKKEDGWRSVKDILGDWEDVCPDCFSRRRG